jgi:hypothetical protein
MSLTIRPVEYFTVTLRESSEGASRLLSQLAGGGVNLLAFNAIPVGLQATQLVIFPEDGALLEATARTLKLDLSGPDRAFLIQGDDELGALAHLHGRLAGAGVYPFASNGVSDGRGGFGYIVYVRREEFDAASRALGT